MNFRHQRGVALIITLIMLAVITFMATTFLVLSRRERNSVSTNTDQTQALFAADSAAERAKAQIMAAILSTTNDQNYGMMVATNFFSPAGFISSLPTSANALTNVNYFYPNGNPLSVADQLSNLTNLLYDPRPPVYVTNRLTGGLDFRFFLDLNRNGQFDASGAQPQLGRTGGFLHPDGSEDGNAANVVTNFMTGDPQWVGQLRFPERNHSADNQFISRWTYLVVPAGQTLDANYIHNQSLNPTLRPHLDGYLRNQGVGPWEINLAAFLADLNTNVWYTNLPVGGPYNYQRVNPLNAAGALIDPTLAPANSGAAFDDARALVSYRYNNNYASLGTVNDYFPRSGPQAAAAVFPFDNIDSYTKGPLMTGTRINEAANRDVVTAYWPGGTSTNHFFTPEEFFDPAKSASSGANSFTNRLTYAGRQADTYDRYTFYRMLAQLGTDSAPPVENKINLNYKNMVNGAVVSGYETNLISWQPLEFFTNAAAMMFGQLSLTDSFGGLITITNIPVYPTTNNNYYTPAVHRILQLAANLFEATSSNQFPCVYRPFFKVTTRTNGLTTIAINGYQLVNGADALATRTSFLTIPVELNYPSGLAAVTARPQNVNVYGIPWIIGARKGFPNFNQLAMQSVSQMTRKLQVTRPTVRNGWTGYHFQQMLIIGVSNEVAVQFWNSYQTSYPRPVYIQADGVTSMSLTNDLGFQSIVPPPVFGTFSFLGGTNLGVGQWFGAGLANNAMNASRFSFQVPIDATVALQPDSYYANNQLFPLTVNGPGLLDWSQIPLDRFPAPTWYLNITNSLRCFVMDGGPSGRVIDYVQLSGANAYRNLTAEAQQFQNAHSLWDTNPVTVSGITMNSGVSQQISIAEGAPPGNEWVNNPLPPNSATVAKAVASFSAFMFSSTVSSNTAQVPFTPTAKNRQLMTWQANDPLVHYTLGDLNYLNANGIPVGSTNIVACLPPNASFPSATSNLWRLNDRYSPWQGPPGKPGTPGAYSYVSELKDPMVRSSDDWDFPTNKLPNVGWIGRVHRGTPWQSIYLKSSDIASNIWIGWSGDLTLWPRRNGTYTADASYHRPVKDRMLFDVFSSSLNDTAARGLLSINQTNLAAWSAILSGVIALTNNPVNATYGWALVNPAGVYSPGSYTTNSVYPIWQGINRTRNGKTFQSLGDILATPELTLASPFLYSTNSLLSLNAGGISDEVMERLPQQVMGLLTLSHTPRFVVYAYGQTLHPAPGSVVTANNGIYSGFFGLCTNYQVTAETATRSVVRVDGSPDPRYTKANPDPFGNYYPPRVVVEQYNVLPPD